MIFSYNWLKEYVKLPKPDKLVELLNMHAFEVEETKKVKGDYLLDIDVLPNRGPDCFSHIGIAREIAAITGSKLNIPFSKIKQSSKSDLSIEVKDRNDCLRYTAMVIKEVKVGSSPKWLKQRLESCGLNSINNIVDTINYVMLETGQPLHTFDLDKLSGNKIIVRRAKRGEKIITLDNNSFDLDKDILVIADSKDPLAIAGIKGGEKAEIDKRTKTIVLESANFDSRLVRQASKKLGLKTDASWRFEHKIDPNLTEQAINRTAELIKGKSSKIIDFYPKKNNPKKLTLNYIYLKKLLGFKIERKEIEDILKRLSFKIIKEKHSILEVKVPSFRLDISIQEDLIEEIGRIYGYEKIPAVFPVASLIPGQRNMEIFWEDATKNIMKELGFTEVYNYSFVGENKNFAYGIELENPMSSEQKYLRPSLIPNILKDIEKNIKNFKEVKIFELGKIFIKGEKRMLTGATNNSFFQLKGAVDSLLNKLGISDIYYDEHQATPEDSKSSVWQKGKTAEIKVVNEEIGFLGEISSNLSKDKVNVFDIDFEKLSKLCSEEHEYEPISQYPSAVRDLAVLVPMSVKVVDVLNKINSVGEKLIRDIDLFDIYEGKGVPQGKKNLAFHIIYQAENKTLRASEINTIQNKIIKALEKNPDWEVRK